MARSSLGLSVDELSKILNDESGNEIDATEDVDEVDDEFEGESDNEEESMSRKVVYQKNGHKWFSNPFHSKNTRTKKENLIHRYPGTREEARGMTNEQDILNLFFSN
ncbi:hypothetical protein C0J52_03319 [Blattella germanica]|nr:hypothetical protein C0J52_03319 [Blattella germanica]